VIVRDGFVGNIAVKFRSLAFQIFGLLKKSLTLPSLRKWRDAFKKRLQALRKTIDYTEYGGAPLLASAASVWIGTAASNANAVKNAIRVAAGLARRA